MTRPWIYTVNTFLIVTDGSYVKMLVISNYHLAHLKSKAGDPFFDALIKVYEPIHTAFVTAYDNWIASGGIEKGGAASQDDLIHELSADLAEAWDIAIQNVYRSGTPQYIALMPHHRKVFQHGTVEDRMSAVSALSKAIGLDAKLVAVKTSVDSFYKSLSDAFSSKGIKQGDIKVNSQEVEAARIKCAVGQFRNLSKLNDQYAEDPSQSGIYFDEATIRSATQVTFTHKVVSGSVFNIARRTLDASQIIVLHVTGTESLVFFSASQKDQQTAEKMIEVLPGQIKTVTPLELGNDKAHPYLMVQNKNSNDSNFDLEIKKSV